MDAALIAGKNAPIELEVADKKYLFTTFGPSLTGKLQRAYEKRRIEIATAPFKDDPAMVMKIAIGISKETRSVDISEWLETEEGLYETLKVSLKKYHPNLPVEELDDIVMFIIDGKLEDWIVERLFVKFADKGGEKEAENPPIPPA